VLHWHHLDSQIAFAMLAGRIMYTHVPDLMSRVGMARIAIGGATGPWITVRGRHESIDTLES
jgi:hypothetical protein